MHSTRFQGSPKGLLKGELVGNPGCLGISVYLGETLHAHICVACLAIFLKAAFLEETSKQDIL